MWLIIGSLFVVSMVLVSIAALIIFANLPNTKERLKFFLPILLIGLIVLVCYLMKWHVPSCEFGKFM